MKNTIKILHPTLNLFSVLLLIAAIVMHFSPLNQGMRDTAPATSLLATGFALLGIITGRLLDTQKFRSAEQRLGDIDDQSKQQTNELEALRQFYLRIYTYLGNYPNWKVQQEYRHLLTTLVSSQTCEFSTPYHLHNIDHYLSRLVDETNAIAHYFPELGKALTDEDLAEARGDYYLSDIQNNHPDAKKEPYLIDRQNKQSGKE
ncbi:hypothetical protein D0C16_08475 [Cellvibrio sp. KY-GH-1]|uniref:hypothetical protein n=1 Tax=Cellvibrio sp. KY-GH-1 TaxID=2303332 RepID=UPI001246956E|nr:hypothetical protein [Cellvibrio sp. KY-GH-1]QEY16009.1 hypothetical protein D0C16_08475 [Cellvibrio sp. KY-GH-1]